jgi:hypothetical protein
MGKLVVLKLDGDFDRGFWATLEIGLDDERPEVEMRGDLPPATELVTQYSGWQSSYRSLGKAKRIIYRALPLLPTTHRIKLKRVKQDSYRSRYRTIRLFPATRAIRPIGVRIDGSLKKKREECRTQASELRDRLNSWLKTESFLSEKRGYKKSAHPTTCGYLSVLTTSSFGSSLGTSGIYWNNTTNLKLHSVP